MLKSNPSKGGIEDMTVSEIGRRETVTGGGAKTLDHAHQCAVVAASEIPDGRSDEKIAMMTVETGEDAVASGEDHQSRKDDIHANTMTGAGGEAAALAVTAANVRGRSTVGSGGGATPHPNRYIRISNVLISITALVVMINSGTASNG